MKRRFSKILGVGLTLSLLVSLLLTVAPVLADVSQPTVDLSHATTDGDEISEDNVIYTISFRINKELVETTDTITVRFPEDTDVAGAGGTNATKVSFTSGIGYPDSGGDKLITAVPDTEDLTVEVPLGINNIGAMAYVQVVITGITNPTEPGDYTLEVMTSAEDTYIESEEYEIGVPTVGGFVYVYNPSNILLATYGGREALETAEGAGHLAKEDYTITVGPGSYDLTGTLSISGAGLILKSSDGAEATIINASDSVIPGINITGDDVTVDGFTVDGSAQDGIVIGYDTTGVTVENNIITDANDSGIVLNANGVEAVVAEATISGNVIEDSGCGINIMAGALDNTISGNTITGCSNESINIDGGLTGYPTKGNTITGNTITANQTMGILLCKHWRAGTYTFFEDNVIEGNTISENEGNGIEIDSTAENVTGLEILDNYIADNEEDGIWIDVTLLTGNVIKFNTITGNDNGIIISIDAVNATFNWWGTTVADDIGDMVSSDVTYEPFLTDIAEAAIAGGKAAANTSSLDAKTECGVKVSGVDDDVDEADDEADAICALKYAANPEEAIDDAIAFYDVYVALESDIVLDEVEATLKFYDTAITTGSTAHFWTGDFWAKCSDQEARDGLVWVTVTEDTAPALDELEGTPFVVVAGEAVLELDAPVIAAPESGAEDVSLKPTLAWGTVADALGYDFELADNPLFVVPIASLTGDLARLITPFYQQVAELDYSTYYYWRVKAVSADAESAWSAGVFFTVAEPEPEPEPEAAVWMCSEGLTFASRAALEKHLATAEAHQPVEPPDIVVVPPDIVVPLPDVAAPITPAWIYVIIGVGAVLIIALLVLIVRTRRVA